MAKDEPESMNDDFDTPEKKVAAWNQWRENDPDDIPDLQGADFSEVSLPGINLSHARLENADLGGAYLENTDCSGAHLDNAKLHSARLENADLRGATGYRFDQTDIRDILVDRDSTEPWLVLRREYTGPKLLFILFLLSIFLVPYAAKTVWWVGVNKGQVVLLEQAEQRREALREKLGVDPLDLVKSPEAMADPELNELNRLEVLVTAQSIVYVQRVQGKAPAITDGDGGSGPSGDGAWKRWRVAQLVIGGDKGWLTWSTALLVLLYNGLRILLTQRVSDLRHDEELRLPSPPYEPELTLFRAFGNAENWKERGYAPIKWTAGYFSYSKWLYRLDRVASVLFYAAIAFGAFHLIFWLSRPVLLPPV